MEFIDLKQQYQRYKEAISSGIERVLEHGKYVLGPQVKELEETLAKYVGVEHCITTASGTDSLLISLMALDIGPGDEVITVPFTWISPAEVIKLLGAKPVFVDIEPETYNIDINEIERAITHKTKAIMPISLFGQMPNYTKINSIAKRHNISVVEDGAQSFGAKQNIYRSCGMTTMGCTSFFPAKPLGCYGEGGAIFTSDEALAAKMRAIRVHGGEVRYHHPYVGVNGRFDTIQAAVLLAKFPHYEEELEARTKIGMRYSELLKDCCVTPVIAENNTHVYAQYTVRVSERKHLLHVLKEKGIPAALYYPKCLHEQPVFKDLGYRYGDFPESEKASKEVLSLPMHPWLTEKEQDKIVNVIKEASLVLV